MLEIGMKGKQEVIADEQILPRQWEVVRWMYLRLRQ